jgi:hypothetical protein
VQNVRGDSSVVLPAALDLHEFRNDVSAVLDISADGLMLRVHAEAGDALLVGGNPKVNCESCQDRTLTEGDMSAVVQKKRATSTLNEGKVAL